MAQIIENPYRGGDLPAGLCFAEAALNADPAPVLALLRRCPAYRPTPLADARALARALVLEALRVKDERTRMGLGSFKALGAAFVIARDAQAAAGDDLTDPSRALTGRTYVAASAGNHGLSVAAGARVFGARAVIYLAETVPAAFADLLRGKGADVVVAGADYEASMAAAAARAGAEGWTLLSDSTWAGYDGGVGVMEGYLALGAEITDALAPPPTHVFLQAGVGGLAAAMTAHIRAVWGDAPIITVVEPEAAPALMGSIRAGRATACAGPVSSMGRLDCKEPSLAALEVLARGADRFMTVSDADCEAAIARLAEHGLATSPSGGAGFAGLVAAPPGPGARVLLILSEGPVDG